MLAVAGVALVAALATSTTSSPYEHHHHDHDDHQPHGGADEPHTGEASDRPMFGDLFEDHHGGHATGEDGDGPPPHGH